MPEVVAYEESRAPLSGGGRVRSRTNHGSPTAPHMRPGRTLPHRAYRRMHVRQQRALHPHGVVETWVFRSLRIDVVDDVDAAAKSDASVHDCELAMQPPQAPAPELEHR